MFKRAVICIGGCAGLGLLGCTATPREEAQGTLEQEIELHDLSDTFGLAFVPPKPLGEGEQLVHLKDRLERQSFPIQATGSVHTNMRDASGALLTYQSIAVRGTCGATLISPSYVITSAHCVSGANVLPNDTVTLEMYRPERRLANETIWRPRTQLTGTFPDYERIPFTSADGYHVDHFTCSVASRCGRSWGDANCPSSIAESGDIALLHCEGRPGARYGYVNVAKTELADVEVFVPWKHEVYDIPETEAPTSDRFRHYVQYPASGIIGENYHYLGDGRNQLLPLMSQPWPDGTPHYKLDAPSEFYVWTDILACHGTSGSGFMQRDVSSGEWQLLGPTTHGGGNLSGFLCHHNPGAIGQREAIPGEGSVSYASLFQTSTLATSFDAQLGADCAPVHDGSFSLPTRTRCEREHSGLPISGRTQYADLSPWSAPVVRLSAGVTEVGKVKVIAGHEYRIVVRAATNASCIPSGASGTTCPELTVRIGEKAVLSARSDQNEEILTAGSVYTAEATDTLAISVRVAGGSFEVGELTLVEDQRVNDFDEGHARSQVAMVVPNASATTPLPARFVGDGQQGFSALLYAGERLLLNREATALRGAFDVSFTTPDVGTIRCGLVAGDGSVLTDAACTKESQNHFEIAGNAVPAGVFFEVPPGSGPVEIDNVRIDVTAAQPQATCTDLILNGSETDVDCGGGSCSGCSNGKVCSLATDCSSERCVGGRCAALPACDDGLKNGTETDVDCGGSCASDCAVGMACLTGADCVSAICTGNQCAALPGGLSAKISKSSAWPGGYCANVTVTNESNSPAQGWTVVFDTRTAKMNNGWSAEFTNVGSVYTAKAMAWNAALGPNKSTSFGYCATASGTDDNPIVVSVSSR
jgi:hypothetical protein